VCGKQIDEITGRRGPDPYLPHLLGHEGAGVVEQVGPAVRKVKPGDHVVLHWIKGSGNDSEPPRFARNGAQVSAGWVTTFSRHTIASENRLTVIPADTPFEAAALLGCAVTTGLGIVFNNAGLRPGETIAVFGVGGVGLNVLQGARLVSAYPVIAFDIHDSKAAQARQFGATHFFNSATKDPVKAVKDLTGGAGAAATVDLTGAVKVREVAYAATSNTGVTVFAGVPEAGERISIESFPLHFGRRVVGSHGGETKPDRDIPRYLGLHARGQLKLEEQITHRFPLSKINEAVDAVRQGRAGRCMVLPWQE
jgi:S-(hydroxymethyl)glutathione dehydrogenase/alcohol dehydrogenase